MNEFNIKNGFISKDNSIVQGSLIATSISAITYYNLPTDMFAGGTVSGETLFTNGLRSNTISATTYYNLPTDIKVTGFTFDNGNYDLTIFNNDDSNFTQSLSILSTDMTVTGGTYDINSGEVTFTNNSGGTFNVSGFASGYTDIYTTGGTYSDGTTIFTKTNGETYSVSGFATTFTGGTVNSLTANTISATTYLNLPINYWSLSGTNIINNNISGVTIAHNTSNSGGGYSTAFKTQYRNNGVLVDGFSVANGGNVSAAYLYATWIVSSNVGVDTNTSLNFGTGISTNRAGNQFTHTSGTVNVFNNSVPFVSVTGNGIYNLFNVAPTINQTGGASGITRGLYINPTLTSAYDFRAIEVVTGKVIVPTGVNSNEAVNKGQLETYTTAQLAGKMNNPSLTASFIPRAITSTSIGNSRLWDTDTYLGIGVVNTPTKDITLGSQANREIGIELSDSSTVGRDLTVTAGKTVDYQLTSNFVTLNQTVQVYRKGGASSNKDFYISSGSILYKQSLGSGNLALYHTSSYTIYSTAVDSSGNIYIATSNGIYKQTAGAGSFVLESGVTTRTYYSMAFHPDGHLYAVIGAVDGGGGVDYIYKRTNNTGDFVAVNVGTARYNDIACAPNGDVYASQWGTGIIKQTGGAGAWSTVVSSTSTGTVCVLSNGTIYAANVYGGVTPYFYISINNGSIFTTSSVSLPVTYPYLVANGNNVYAYAFYGSNIFFQNNESLGTNNLKGGTLKLNSGTGKGSGDSSIEMYTGQILASGTTMQTATLRAKIDNTGLMTLPSVTNALISGDTTGKAVVTKEYLNTANYWTNTGSNIYNNNTGNIIIGASATTFQAGNKLSVVGSVSVTGKVWSPDAQGFRFSDGSSGMYHRAAQGLEFVTYGDGTSALGHYNFTPIYPLGGSPNFVSNTTRCINTSGTYAAISGSVSSRIINIEPTINQTGTANGIIRGLYINPTLTSAYDFRAIEVTAGKVIVPTAINSNEAVNKGQVDNRLVVETTTGYTLTNVDSGGIVIFKTMSAQTLNIPLSLANGFECTFVTLSGVTLTVPAVSGITLNNALGNLLPPQSSFTLKRMLTTNEFIATGNL
jgi:hypothetical protein